MSLQQKVDIIKQVDGGDSKSSVARRLGLNESTVRSICKQKEKLLSLVKAAGSEGAAKRSRIRPEAKVRMEQMLELYLRRQEAKSIPVSRRLIRNTALRLHRACLDRYPPAAEADRNFTASPGWLSNFCSRYGVRHVAITGERASANTEEAEKFPAYLEQLVEEGNYSPDQVYNMDECGLIWKKMSTSTYLSRHSRQARGRKLDKSRVTLDLSNLRPRA